MNHINNKGVLVHEAVKKGNTTQFFTHISPHIKEIIYVYVSHLCLGLSIMQVMSTHRKHFLEVYERGE